ncbi:hypothetical protein KY334_07135 [Candidatus Woesearchaeota archaeon]|nr:hypothetical protein [Candidatus Woesearchaeota archaeon]
MRKLLRIVAFIFAVIGLVFSIIGLVFLENTQSNMIIYFIAILINIVTIMVTKDSLK